MELETRNLKQNNSLPAISVIIPVYNAEKTIRQCVNSILSQEYKNYELLLINDGSKDASPAICDEYARQDDRVRVFHKENGGVSSARNLGLDNAQGEWITFVDSDDYIAAGYFDKIAEHNEDVIFMDYNTVLNGVFWGFGSKRYLFSNVSIKDFLYYNFSTNYLRSPCIKFYKHSIIDCSRFHTDMKIAEDYCFVMEYLSKCNTIATISSSFYIICTHEIDQESRYPVSVDYAVKSLSHLLRAFDSLNERFALGKDKFISIIGFFKAASISDWKDKPSRWWNNKEIISFYEYVWPALSFKQKMRLTMSRFMRR